MYSEKQIPRGLKPARDDKKKHFTARLKPRPFNNPVVVQLLQHRQNSDYLQLRQP